MENYELVKLDELTPGEEVGFKNPREKLSDIGQLAADIEAHGLLNPLQVWKTTKDDAEIMVLVGGFRRQAAIQLLIEEGRANGFSKGVPSNIIKANTLKAARYIALADNIQRAELTSYETAMECLRLREDGDSQKVIAKGLNKSETWVSRKLSALESAGTALKKAWKSGKLTDDNVEHLATLAEVDEESGEVDFSAQDTAVEEILAEAAAGGESRDSKSKTRKKVKEKAGKASKLGSKVIKELVMMVDSTPEESVERPDYVRGVFDTLRLVQGSISLGKLDPEWKEYMKAADAAAKEKAKEDAEKAKEWARNVKENKGKKGKKAKE